MRVQITDRNDDGRGRGRNGEQAVLVSQAHPGEEVVVRVDKTTRGTVQGRVSKILRADPERISHHCRHEFHCTGCPLLAASGRDEASFKVGRIREALRRAGAGGAEIRELVRPSGLFGYRHFAKQVVGRRGKQVIPGAWVTGTHRVVDTSGCPVLVPELAELLQGVAMRAGEREVPLGEGEGGRGLRYLLARQSREGEQHLVLVTTSEEGEEERRLARVLIAEREALVGATVFRHTGEGNVLLDGTIAHTLGEKVLRERVAGFEHRIGPTAFFQIQPAAVEAISERVAEAVGSGERCLEAFAGSGALTLPLTRSFRSVRAVESHAGAVEELRASAQRAGVAGQVQAEPGRVEDVFPRWLAEGGAEAAVLDPPRRGLGAALAGAVAASSLDRIALVSCEPKALSKDLPPFLDAGWRVEWVAPIDQFPRTAHVETVTALRRG